MSKRILSLVLALVMVLGTFGTVFADTAADHDPKVQWLIDQGLLQGDGSGDYGLTKTVTRDVLARIVAVALQDEVSAMSLQALPSGFADMTPAHWANGYASYANAKGYMIGNAKREFMPAGTVTYAEALVVLTKIALNGDLTAAEKANALTWYAPYVAKANEIGVTEGVSIANVGAQAVKEDILKMLYNVLNNKNFGNYNVIKAIVLENDRIARVGANEVTVEVIKEVQRANFVEETRKDLKGEQYTYELPAKFNAEDLLGKVVDLSIDKNGKVVEVKVDTTYEVLTGAVWGITPSRLTINNKQYIVNLDERYNKEDERVYRTYLNDKDLKYSDFAKDHEEVEYARVTVKAGKVLFVDAYDFNDIMPVKEVKEVKGKNTILSYDDVRNNNLIETEVKATRVILVNGKTFTRGTLEDVKADNVIHTYKVGSSTKYVVLQDKAIEGKLEKIKEDKDGEYVVVGGEEYYIPTVSPKEAVYEFQTDGKFYTLDAKTAYRELDNFRGEEVKVLLSLGEELQYIGSNVGFGEFMGVATRVIGKEMRVVTPENKAVDYTGNLDTTLYVKDAKTPTAHQGLNNVPDNSLVYINADGEVLKVVRNYDDRTVTVGTLTERLINTKRITDDTVVYVVNTNGKVEVRKIADVVKAWKKLNIVEQAAVRASLIDEAEFHKISTRGLKFANSDHVHTVVLYNLNIAPEAKTGTIFGKLIRYDDRKVGKYEFTVELSNESRRTFTLDKNSIVNFVVGNIYEISESKTTEDVALSLTEVNFTGYKTVKSIANGLYTFTDGTTNVYETRNTEIFGRRPIAGDKISYKLDGKDMEVIVNPGYATASTDVKGVISGINGFGANGSFVVDEKEVYYTDAKTVVTDKDGNVLFIGGAATTAPAAADLSKGDEVEVTVRDGVATTIKRISIKVDRDAAAAKAAAKTALADAITKAEALKEADYTNWATLDVTEAIVDAKAVYNDATATTTELKTAKSDLEAVVNQLEFAGMQALVTELNKSSALNHEDYTIASWTAYQVELVKAAGVASEPKSNVEVLAAEKALREARLALVKNDATKAMEILDAATFTAISVDWNTDEATTLEDALAAVKAQVESKITKATVVVAFDSEPTVTNAGLAAADYTFNVNITGTDASTTTTTVSINVTFKVTP